VTNRHLRYGDAQEAGMSDARLRHLRRLGAKWVDCGQAASLTMLVARRGVVVLHEAYGRLGPEPDATALPLDAVYPISSITKPITATCAMCLVEDGVLGLHRPVQEYVPEFIGDGKDAVMIHHLLTHTSGITPEAVGAHATLKQERGELESDEAEYPGIGKLPLWARGDRSLYDVPVHTPPGSEMTYCNFNYTLLADIIGRVAGQSAVIFADERVFRPLGMVDTCFTGIDPARLPRFVRRDPNDAFARLNNPAAFHPFAGAAGATSTAWDIAVFGQMFLNRGRYGDVRILSRPTVDAMTRDQVPGIEASYAAEHFGQAGWGYGWNIRLGKKETNRSGLTSPRTFEHGGAGGVDLLVDPEYELVLVYCSVETSSQVGAIHQWYMDHFTDVALSAIND
jgi:serine-type D-Ala-D-Ala carboxypeptidase